MATHLELFKQTVQRFVTQRKALADFAKYNHVSRSTTDTDREAALIAVISSNLIDHSLKVEFNNAADLTKGEARLRDFTLIFDNEQSAMVRDCECQTVAFGSLVICLSLVQTCRKLQPALTKESFS